MLSGESPKPESNTCRNERLRRPSNNPVPYNIQISVFPHTHLNDIHAVGEPDGGTAIRRSAAKPEDTNVSHFDNEGCGEKKGTIFEHVCGCHGSNGQKGVVPDEAGECELIPEKLPITDGISFGELLGSSGHCTSRHRRGNTHCDHFQGKKEESSNEKSVSGASILPGLCDVSGTPLFPNTESNDNRRSWSPNLEFTKRFTTDFPFDELSEWDEEEIDDFVSENPYVDKGVFTFIDSPEENRLYLDGQNNLCMYHVDLEQIFLLGKDMAEGYNTFLRWRKENWDVVRWVIDGKTGLVMEDVALGWTALSIYQHNSRAEYIEKAVAQMTFVSDKRKAIDNILDIAKSILGYLLPNGVASLE